MFCTWARLTWQLSVGQVDTIPCGRMLFLDQKHSFYGRQLFGKMPNPRDDRRLYATVRCWARILVHSRPRACFILTP